MRNTKTNPSYYQGYSYIPAAINLDVYNIALYVRYRTGRKSNHMRVRHKSPAVAWVECPDRDLYVVSNPYEIDAFHPGDYDECLHFNLFDQESAHELGINYVMPNFVHDNGEKSSADSRKSGNLYPNGDPRRVTVLADSGGFQYVSGKADWVNPVELADWYNDNVDAGMQLDIPLTVPLGARSLKRYTNLQNRITSLMRSRLKPHVELVNVVHGKTMDNRRRYRDAIEEEHGDLNRFAFGGMVSYGPLGLAHTATEFINTGKRYSQYHMLGITSSLMFPVLVAMGHLGWQPHITSDSSTHKMAANARTQYFQHELGRLRTYPVGAKALDLKGIKDENNKQARVAPVVNRYLDCNCPVCSRVKYADVLGILNGPFTLSLLSIHNIIHSQRYVNLMKEVIANESYDYFMNFIKQSHSTHSGDGHKELMRALDYLQVYHQESPKAAHSKFKDYILDSNSRHSTDVVEDLRSNAPLAQSEAAKEETRLRKIRNRSEEMLALIESGKTIKGNKKSSGSKQKSVKSNF